MFMTLGVQIYWNTKKMKNKLKIFKNYILKSFKIDLNLYLRC